MNDKELRSVVERILLAEIAKLGQRYVPVMSSNRHVHLSQQDVERLFGTGYQLTKMRDLVQPGQFACNERVTIETEKGKLTLRVVGPARSETQIELSATEAFKLGLKAPIRMSGDLRQSPGCTLSNGDKRIAITQGVIVAARHLHLAPDEALAYGLKDGDVVSLRVGGPRATTLENVIVRSGNGHVMEAHIDKDEANACALADGQLCEVLVNGHAAGSASPALAGVLNTVLQTGAANASPKAAAAQAPARDTMLDLTGERRLLLTEDDVRAAAAQGYKRIRHSADAIITPLAKDSASDRGIELVQAYD